MAHRVGDVEFDVEVEAEVDVERHIWWKKDASGFPSWHSVHRSAWSFSGNVILIDDHEYSCESEICVLSSHVRECEFFNHLQTCSNNKQYRFIFMPTSMFLGKFYIYIIIIIFIYIHTVILSTKGMIEGPELIN